jgi:hypothetical protein
MLQANTLVQTIAEKTAMAAALTPPTDNAGTKFTCFTSTKVQVLIPAMAAALTPPIGNAGLSLHALLVQKLQILTPALGARWQQVLSLLALLVHKYKY